MLNEIDCGNDGRDGCAIRRGVVAGAAGNAGGGNASGDDEVGKTTIELETPFTAHDVAALADVVHSPADQAATISSGSFRTDGMIVIPCSMKTLAGIRAGYAEGLVGRAADVVLKEGRKLVLVPRETPLSTIHLENMLALSRMGVAMVPPMPAYYNHPQTADDITQHIVTRVLDQFGLEHKKPDAGKVCRQRNIFHRRIKMAFDDLRSFLQALDEQGQLLKIEEEVNAEPDLAAAANATGRIGDGAPALWFDNIRGFTDARVVMNTIGSWQNHAISMGLPANTPVKTDRRVYSSLGQIPRLARASCKSGLGAEHGGRGRHQPVRHSAAVPPERR